VELTIIALTMQVSEQHHTAAAGVVPHLQVGHQRCELPGACLVQVL
jgi:hypothetical protein|tara:strand:- start:939 stop:1076 length:138 start_codon:yes stop_codon:yes gene_type:complete